MKRIILLFTATLLIFSLAITANAHDKTLVWFIKRNGNDTPKIPSEAEFIEKYNGYYVDKHAICNNDKNVLYLTFDIGYENGNTEKILDTLKEKNVPAAFFVLDHVILKNTDLVLRMANEGHLVCNHTKNHKDLTKCSEEEIANNVIALEKIYTQKTGLLMSKYFRFPEGKYSEDSIKAVNSLGYKTIFWSFAYADWDNARQPSENAAIKKILNNTHNGAVILLHPTSRTNAKILPQIIDKWREMGYEFGTLDDLTSK